MAAKDFFPNKESEIKDWLINFKTNIAAVAAQIGITPTEITELTNTADILIADIDNQTQKEQELKSAIETKHNNRDTLLPLFRALIANIKSRRTYTKPSGELLGIVGRPRPKIDYDTIKPVAKIQTVANEVKIGFIRGNTHGVNIYCKRGNETTFSLVVRVFNSPFIDTRSNLANASSERREYYLRYLRGDIEVGQNSNIAVINV